jgi:hypothetical protein
MDTVIKALVFIAMGTVVLTVNAWYIGLIYRSIKDPGVIIAPIRIVGGPAGASDMDEVLARMLLVRIRSIKSDLERGQSSLEKGSEVALPREPTGIAPTLFARTVHLDAQLFEPAKMDINVAGVDVGGFVPWIQRWLDESRTLSFTVSLEDHAAIVAGNIDALDNRRRQPIWFRIENQSAEAIVDGIALALIQRAWVKEGKDGPEIGELTLEEFRTFVQSVGRLSEINGRVRTLKLPARPEFAAVLNEVTPLAERITGWAKLTYFVATIAEGAEDNQRALLLYQRLKNSGKAPISNELIEEKLKVLGRPSLEGYRRQAAEAAQELSKLFGFEISVPPIELLPADYLNVYWDGTKINIPPDLEDIPDLMFHEMSLLFIQKLWAFKWEGQSGALGISYTDVLTSIVKQVLMHQTAEQADWTIAPGAIAWLTMKTRSGGSDQRPLRSLKAPGTAYDDSTLGKDPQVAHVRDLKKTDEAHAISGIPNKAFYEAAIHIGTDKAGRIWVEALKQFKDDMDFREASGTILKTASQIYGENSDEAIAVQEAWKAVGL